MTSDDKKLTLTDTLTQAGKGYRRKLKAKDFDVWVNDKYLKDFGAAKYYASHFINPFYKIHFQNHPL